MSKKPKKDKPNPYEIASRQFAAIQERENWNVATDLLPVFKNYAETDYGKEQAALANAELAQQRAQMNPIGLALSRGSLGEGSTATLDYIQPDLFAATEADVKGAGLQSTLGKNIYSITEGGGASGAQIGMDVGSYKSIQDAAAKRAKRRADMTLFQNVAGVLGTATGQAIKNKRSGGTLTRPGVYDATTMSRRPAQGIGERWAGGAFGSGYVNPPSSSFFGNSSSNTSSNFGLNAASFIQPTKLKYLK